MKTDTASFKRILIIAVSTIVIFYLFSNTPLYFYIFGLSVDDTWNKRVKSALDSCLSLSSIPPHAV